MSRYWSLFKTNIGNLDKRLFLLFLICIVIVAAVLLFLFKPPETTAHIFDGRVVGKMIENENTIFEVEGITVFDDKTLEPPHEFEIRRVVVGPNTVIERRVSIIPRKEGIIDGSEIEHKIEQASIDEILVGELNGDIGSLYGSNIRVFADDSIFSKKEFEANKIQIIKVIF